VTYDFSREKPSWWSFVQVVFFPGGLMSGVGIFSGLLSGGLLSGGLLSVIPLPYPVVSKTDRTLRTLAPCQKALSSDRNTPRQNTLLI